LNPNDVDAWLAARNWPNLYGAASEAELYELFNTVLVAGGLPVGKARLLADEYARNRSAALIKGLEDTTRAQVRELVAANIKSGAGIGDLTTNLREHSVFSQGRAQMIARTETTKSLRTGTKEAARYEGRDQKLWQTNGPGACDDCQANADADWVGIDDDFPSGEDVHPSCECDVQYRTAALHEGDEE
jgi:hypothetical protein